MHTHQEPILFLCIVLSLVGSIDDVQLMEGRSVASHLGTQSSTDVLLSLDLLLPFLYDAHDSIVILELILALPEHLGIRPHLTCHRNQIMNLNVFYLHMHMNVLVHPIYTLSCSKTCKTP